MLCPNCNGKLEIPDNAVRNMETCLKSCHTIIYCCGKIVRVKPRVVFDIEFADPSIKVDDWGNETE
jgi:RNase P subunit RPR2